MPPARPPVSQSPPPPPKPMSGPMDGTPRRPRTLAPSVPDIEILTPTPGRKHRRIRSPPFPPYTPVLFQRHALPALFPPTRTSEQARGAVTPRVLGPAHTTFRSPLPPSPMTPRESRNLLSSLNQVAMHSPAHLALGTEPDSPATADTTSTDRCSTENSRCITPDRLSASTEDDETLSCSTHSSEGTNPPPELPLPSV